MKVLSVILAVTCCGLISAEIQWQLNEDWAFGCDFKSNDLFSVKTTRSRCGATCLAIDSCTHYAWNNYETGTCWLKRGKVTKSDAIAITDKSAICGLVNKPEIVISPAPPKKGSLLWSSEFNSAQDIDSEWIQETGGHGWGNWESQYYTDKGANAKVLNNSLVIEARKEQTFLNKYSSARLVSKRAFRYGIFEMRAKLPGGQGIWPAFWMLSAIKPLSWPHDGEIDIMEYIGAKPNEIFGTIHCGAYNHLINTQKGEIIKVQNEKDWNTYSVEWTKDSIRVFANDIPYFQFDNDKKNKKETWPFDNELNILLNIAVGGVFGGQLQSIDDSVFPQKYTVDYVRHFQYKE